MAMTDSYDKLFVYGTLMVPEIVRIVLGRPLEGTDAHLLNYRPFMIKDACYPALASAAGYTTEGLVYSDISPSEMATLDAYEGAMYEKRLVSVTYADGTEEAVLTYVVAPAYRHRLDSKVWCLDAFMSRHMNDYIAELLRA